MNTNIKTFNPWTDTFIQETLKPTKKKKKPGNGIIGSNPFTKSGETPFYNDLYDTNMVKQDWVDDYLKWKPGNTGEHYRDKLYSFMLSVVNRCDAMGFPLDTDKLADIAKDLDILDGKLAKPKKVGGWYDIEALKSQAEAAINFVEDNAYPDNEVEAEAEDTDESEDELEETEPEETVLPFPWESIPDDFRMALDGIKNVTNAPVEAAAPVALATISTAAQHLYNVDPVLFGDEKGVPISDYFVIVTPPSGGKSSVFKKIIKAIDEYETDNFSEYAERENVYKVEADTWKAEAKQAKKKEEVIPNRPAHPLSNKRYISNTTYSGLLMSMRRYPCQAFLTSEGHTTFGNHDFQDNGKGSLYIASVNDIWDGSPTGKTTGVGEEKNGEIYIPTPRLTIGVMIQGGRLQQFWSKDHVQDSGFRNRVLLVKAPGLENTEAPDSLSEAKKKRHMDVNFTRFQKRIRELLDKDIKFTETPNGTYQFDWEKLELTDESYKVFADFNNIFYTNADPVDNWYSYSQRLPQHALRLAALLTAYSGGSEVTKEYMESGCELAKWFYSNIRCLDLSAHETGNWMTPFINGLLKEGLNRNNQIDFRDMRRLAFFNTRKLNHDSAERVIKSLLDDGLIEQKEDVKKNAKKFVLTDEGIKEAKKMVGTI